MVLMKTQLNPCRDRPVAAAGVFDHRGVAWVGQLEAQHPDLFAGDSGRASQHFGSEDRLYARGAGGGCAYIVSSGLVRFERVTAAGSRRIIRIAGGGDLIGQEALLRQAYRDDAVACTPVALRRVSPSLLDEADWQGGRLSISLMKRWQHTLDEAEFWSTEVATGSSRRRVLQLLARLDHHRDEAGLIWLPKRDQMGDMLNITLETCSRVLSALRRDGVLDFAPPRRARLHAGQLAVALAADFRS
jgi:CRP-like cAMP-binding protein